MFYHKKSAEYLERLFYVCPKCGLAEFESHGNTVACKKCGLKAKYLPTKEFEGVGEEFPFRFVADWYDYQCDVVNRLDYTRYLEQPIYQEKADLWEVILYQRKELLAKAVALSLYGDRIVIGVPGGSTKTYAFDDISVITVLGRNKLNFYVGDKVYQVKGAKSFNALKYMNFYWRYKNTIGESGDGEFLGL